MFARAPDGQHDAAGLFFQNALHHRQISFFYGALVERFAKLGVRRVILGNQNHAGSLFVEAMHDSGTQRVTAFGKLQAPPKQRVHQRTRHVPRAGMDGHSRGLVDGNDVFVFVKDFERDGLGFGDHRGAPRNFDGDFFASPKMQRTFCGNLPVEFHAPRFDQFLDASTAQFGALCGHKAVEARSRVGRSSDEFSNYLPGGRSHREILAVQAHELRKWVIRDSIS